MILQKCKNYQKQHYKGNSTSKKASAFNIKIFLRHKGCDIIAIMINGIINLKKEVGMTSHDAVFQLRKILKEKKIGHGGTLDPDVEGVLPIAVGKATRVIEFMTEAGKAYEGQITLGYSTSTEDVSGDIIEQKFVSPEMIDESKIDHAMTSFIGDITQVPPMYSAVKVNGKKLYEYAREGIEIERPSRQVRIFDFKRTSGLEFDEETKTCRFSFSVKCSKGTYIRTLSVDLGRKCGFPSHMSKLIRTESAGLTLDSALTLENVKKYVEDKDYSFLLPIEYGVSDLEKVQLTDEQVTEISFGRTIRLASNQPVLAAFSDEKLIAILTLRQENFYKPKKVLI